MNTTPSSPDDQVVGRSYDTDRVLTIPNLLSFLRLIGVPVFVWLMLGPRADGWAVALLMFAGFSDWLDGHLARAWHQTSRVGQMLDPVADRLYIASTLVALAVRQLIPWWLVLLLVARDVLMLALVPLLRTRGYTSLPVHLIGKAATFCLLYAFPMVLLGEGQSTIALVCKVLGWAFAIWGTALYWWAGLLYVRQTFHLLQTPRAPRAAR
ncbi:MULTISPECIES: CDP-alcohol phosphatidyltransferase family protein [unclassified Luteococcus]|uniref:CDP-alcohol phosphatidyltransferase family protein n=1 Tax=unclassified Luteococcus TaxID=2639923 RepID=UPI00313F2438